MDTMTRMTPFLFPVYWIPNRPLAGNIKGASYRTDRETALQSRFIQTHPKNNRNLLVLDFDGDESDWKVKELVYDMGRIPEPNYVTINPETGGAHVAYFIKEGVGTDKGIQFFQDVFEGLKAVSGSDPDFTGYKTRNPLHESQVTNWGTSYLYSLKELKTFIKPMPKQWYSKKNPLEPVGRHNILFNKLSAWSYREWKKTNFEVRILLEAHRLNEEFSEPLPVSDVMATVRSIQGFISRHFSEEKFSAIQSARGKLRWDGQGDRTQEELEAYIEAGFSNKEIAELRGQTVGAVRTAVSRAKKRMEAREASESL